MLVIGNGRLVTRDAGNPFIENGAVAMDGNVIKKVGTIMGVVKRTLGKAIRNWEARRLMTAHNAGVSRKKQLERVWPHPLTTEKRHELAQGVSGLVHSEN